jgi:hypothetical protein
MITCIKTHNSKNILSQLRKYGLFIIQNVLKIAPKRNMANIIQKDICHKIGHRFENILRYKYNTHSNINILAFVIYARFSILGNCSDKLKLFDTTVCSEYLRKGSEWDSKSQLP